MTPVPALNVFVDGTWLLAQCGAGGSMANSTDQPNPKGRHRVRRGDLDRVADSPGRPYDPTTDAQGIAQLRRKL
jgi:hypothetical protein